MTLVFMLMKENLCETSKKLVETSKLAEREEDRRAEELLNFVPEYTRDYRRCFVICFLLFFKIQCIIAQNSHMYLQCELSYTSQNRRIRVKIKSRKK